MFLVRSIFLLDIPLLSGNVFCNQKAKPQISVNNNSIFLLWHTVLLLQIQLLL
jgi:hypothetical protein